jgi:hypothetical protein
VFIAQKAPVLLTRQHRGSAEKREVENEKEKSNTPLTVFIIARIFKKTIGYFIK